MATVSSAINTIIGNVQGAASQLTSEVLGALDAAYNYLPDPEEFGILPEVSHLPPATFVEPTGLLSMLEDARTSLEEIGNDIPLLSELASSATSAAMDKYLVYADKYKGLISGRMSLITDVTTRAFPIAGYVKAEADKVEADWSPALAVPAGVAAAFSGEIIARVLDQSAVAYQRARVGELILQSNVDVSVEQLAIRKQLLEVTSLLAFAGSALQGAYTILRKTIVSPEDILRIFRQLSDARTSVASGIASNRAAYAGTQMEYINAVIDYYELFSELEKVRLDVSGLGIERDSEYAMLKAVQLAGAGGAAAHIAAAGYSAARVGFVLSEKAFS